MAQTTRDRIALANEFVTSKNAVSTVVSKESKKDPNKPTVDFVYPTFREKNDYYGQRCTIFVYDSNDKPVIEPFTNFVVQGIEFVISDRVSRTAVMDGEVRVFMGMAPIRVAFSLALLDYKNHAWYLQFKKMWTDVLRGSVLQKIGGKVYVYCAGDLFIGDLHTAAMVRRNVEDGDGLVTAQIQMDCDTPPVSYMDSFTGLEEYEEYLPPIRNIFDMIKNGIEIEKKVF